MDYIFNYKNNLTTNQLGFDTIEINLVFFSCVCSSMNCIFTEWVGKWERDKVGNTCLCLVFYVLVLPCLAQRIFVWYLYNIDAIFAKYLHNICTISSNICKIFVIYLQNTMSIFVSLLEQFLQYLLNICLLVLILVSTDTGTDAGTDNVTGNDRYLY